MMLNYYLAHIMRRQISDDEAPWFLFMLNQSEAQRDDMKNIIAHISNIIWSHERWNSMQFKLQGVSRP